jgi:hypothetical protein
VKVSRGQRNESPQLGVALDTIRAERLGTDRRRKRPERVVADRGYNVTRKSGGRDARIAVCSLSPHKRCAVR